MAGFGECLPRKENAVSIDPTLVDHLGIPSLHIDFSFGDKEAAMVRDVSETAVEMLEAAGALETGSFAEHMPPGRAIHEMGGARMGRDPRTSMLDAWNEVHDVENYADGSRRGARRSQARRRGLATEGSGLVSCPCRGAVGQAVVKPSASNQAKGKT